MLGTYISKSGRLLSKQNVKTCNVLNYSNEYVSGSAAVKLSYSIFEPQQGLSPSKAPVIILHGLLGSKQNWRSLGKIISNMAGRKVYALDARNHGDSPHSQEFNYILMSHDVKQFMKSESLSQAVIMGHSMGGRTAMLLAISKPELVEKLVVVDVSPCSMPETSSTVIPGYLKAMKEAVKNIPPGIPITQARKVAEQHMSKTIPEKGICQFLLTNLQEEKNNFGWKANIDVLERTFESVVRNFHIPDGHYNGETLFICGGDSPYVRPEDHAFTKNIFPKAKFVYVPGAGHWVHSEKPSEFLAALSIIF